MKGIAAAGGLAAISGTAYATDSHDEDEPAPVPDTGVRVGHFAADAPNVDVLVDGAPVLEDVPYRTVSPYLELPAGTYGVQVTAAGDPETVVFDEEVTVEDGTLYSAFAIGLLEPGELEDRDFEVQILVDCEQPEAEPPKEDEEEREEEPPKEDEEPHEDDEKHEKDDDY